VVKFLFVDLSLARETYSEYLSQVKPETQEPNQVQLRALLSTP